MLSRLSAVVASILVHQIHLLCTANTVGVKQFPGYENLPRSFWHELSSPFTEVYEVENFVTETGGTPEPRPFFEDPESNVTVQLGAEVYMHCRIQNLQNNLKVSWVRRRGGDELHLLTIGLDTYASDSRFSLAFEKPNDWRLLLRSATERDAGLYECQVSAHPPLIRTVHLAVSVPKVEIVDEHGATAGDKFYKAGSTIELKCVVSNIPQPTGYVTWRHGSRTLNYDTTRGGISVKTDMGAAGAVSRLYIANANKMDSGNYSCALADVAAATMVSVHVLNGENPAAMQHGGTSAPRATFIFTVVISLSSLLR
ncbi:peroxidasin [Pseudomyrmex gracilis]|uniref:peroxidasin n=1 Tax=Pseudomyrmex gracilis TaxID=219809 RepID=UPI0009950E01|nr:peroxidasin [Pseudomyrmex gracilis]XP_020285525.1 peroxidasin [Pseudomyrmex gracilis]XP_020285527.1 peroxidasin [Pseudomyrmex gracilis]XP_020285528.1 peroxidasin [Pseudomyrmex gracilis]XP_020285529.1 peroxidasin [Pseudomyrmex gracilis]XP_020285530.1 peroxidasin [Pseudomyrmex gracilis]XP_020285531.1 peroxidasin [Pseudomyrmex gracilis]XP_020285532.1 peroxidasin [Pseudomyrmex gracilis]XP_020285533.1 peroxidasin [Pseudomyrmex gracilis]